MNEWQRILKFWLGGLTHDERFAKNRKLDNEIRRRYLKTYKSVLRGEKAHWRKHPRGRLAEIIVLDQFSRNMFRGTPESYIHDPMALALAQEAVRSGADMKLTKEERLFMYLPFMHSESDLIQKESIRLFKKYGDKQVLWFARDHKMIIDKFGRYPHRNKALRRKSTPAEKAFLKIHKGY